MASRAKQIAFDQEKVCIKLPRVRVHLSYSSYSFPSETELFCWLFFRRLLQQGSAREGPVPSALALPHWYLGQTVWLFGPVKYQVEGTQL